ncbi:MAG: AAA family ATPase, partial [Bacteroidota bacterium]
MLTNLNIRNFKAIQSADLPLRAITLFTGINAVGKSSALQCLLLLRQSIREGGFSKGLFLKQEEYLNLGIGKDVFSIGSEPEATLDIGLQVANKQDWR